MSFVKDTFVTSGSRLVSMALNVGVASASAWLLGPEGRGELAIYIVFGTLLALATSSGVEMAGAYYAGTKKHRLPEVILAEIFIIVVATVISIGVASVLWFNPPKIMEKMTRVGMLISIGYVPTMLAYTSFWYLHTALGYTLSYCWGSVLSVGFTLAGILLFCFRGGGAEAAMLAYVISGLLTSVFLLIELARKHKMTGLALTWGCIRDLYAYGIKYYFARMAQFLNMQIGTVVIAFLGTKADIGFFAAAMGLVAKLTILPEILSAVLLSRVVKGQQTSLELTAKVVRAVFWLILFASGALALFCKPLVWIVLSPKFLPVVVPVWFLLPGIVVRCCSKTLGVYFNGIGRPEINSVAIVSAVLTNIVAMYFLMPLYGITGAAIAATMGYLIDGVVLLAFYRFSLKHPLSKLLPGFRDLHDLTRIIISSLSSRASTAKNG